MGMLSIDGRVRQLESVESASADETNTSLNVLTE